MTLRHRARQLLCGLGLAALWATSPSANAQPTPPTDALTATMREAFLYGYPYYEFMWLRDQALNQPQSLTHTTLNTFRHQRHLATPQDRWANGPITDTLYSTAWLDLQGGPVMLQLPDTADRYYVVVLISADTNSFHYLGRRSTGTQARRVLIVGPDWNGPLPTADEVVRAPSRDLYLNMRVLVNNAADLPQAHALQDRFTLTPLQPTPATPAPLSPIPNDVGRMIDIINEALTRNPPPAHEAPLLQRHQAVGICGAACRFEQLSPALQERWRQLVPPMVARLKSVLDVTRADVAKVNGWIPFRLPRNFADDYRKRAGSAANSGGIFGLEAAEATYFFAVADEQAQALGQGRRYRLHLPQGRLPADAFWSITLYEFQAQGQYLLDTPTQRHAIGDRTPGLVRNADGSLDVWIQPDPPADPQQRANWLPSPRQNTFYMNARLYQPQAEVLSPDWAMPPVQRLLD